MSQSQQPAAAVEVKNLRAGYGNQVIIHDVSFSVPSGQIVCLIGGSGCGKSTVVRTLVGLLRPMAGTVRVLGDDPHQLSEADRDRLLRRIGMMYQNGALLGSMTVGDNIALPFREHTALSEPIIRRIVESKLALVDLPNTAHLMPAQLSGGMRKRASLSRAIALDPDLLLCDEPSAGLDPIVAAGLDATMRQLQRELGMTMIVVTHELASIALIADHIVMLEQGRVLAEGTVQQLQSSDNPKVRHFFGRTPPADTRSDRTNLLTALEANPGADR